MSNELTRFCRAFRIKDRKCALDGASSSLGVHQGATGKASCQEKWVAPFQDIDDEVQGWGIPLFKTWLPMIMLVIHICISLSQLFLLCINFSCLASSPSTNSTFVSASYCPVKTEDCAGSRSSSNYSPHYRSSSLCSTS